jgi:hypothetical protein
MEEAKEIIAKIHPDSKFPSRDDVKKSIGNPERKCSPFYTKYEYTELLGLRVNQLCHGAVPLVSYSEFDTTSPDFMWNVANKEIVERKLPYIIGRTLPDKTMEYWSAMELQLL